MQERQAQKEVIKTSLEQQRLRASRLSCDGEETRRLIPRPGETQTQGSLGIILNSRVNWISLVALRLLLKV